jgi:amidase
MAQELPPVNYPRLPGYRRSGEENRYGALYVNTTIEGLRAGEPTQNSCCALERE